MSKCVECGKNTWTEEHGEYEWAVGDGTGAVLCMACVALPEWKVRPVCGIRGCEEMHEEVGE